MVMLLYVGIHHRVEGRTGMVKTLFCSGALVALLVALPGRAEATTYEVGPGKTYANIGDVPLESLTAGDTCSSTTAPRRTRKSS
jgi:hypothetical protein